MGQNEAREARRDREKGVCGDVNNTWLFISQSPESTREKRHHTITRVNLYHSKLKMPWICRSENVHLNMKIYI